MKKKSGGIRSRGGLPSGGLKLSTDAIAIYLGLIDVLMVFVPSVAIYAIYVGWNDLSSAYVGMAMATSIVTVTIFYLTDLYRLDAVLNPTRYLRTIVFTLAIAFLLTVAFLFALKQSALLSRVWLFSSFLVGSSLVIFARWAASAFLSSYTGANKISRNIIVVGGGEQGRKLIQRLTSLDEPWNRIIGLFDDRRSRVSKKIGSVQNLGNIDDLLSFAREHRCDEILVALPWSAERRIREVTDRLRVLPVHVSLSPDLAGLTLISSSFHSCAGVPVLDVYRRPIAGWKAMLKRAEDWLIGGMLGIASLPLILIIAILIKIDSRGPVFFKQLRYGFNDQLINVYKFRTMKVDEEDVMGSRLTSRDDPRVTRIGRFLRRFSLDELPQFFNVLKGEMSVVGPRPHAVEAKAGDRLYRDVVAKYASRHRVKPGITGWAQINGWRGVTDNDEQILRRVDYDLQYIEHWSLGLDLRIILLTIPSILSTRNAV